MSEIRRSGAEMVYGSTLKSFSAIAAAQSLNLPSLWNVRESEPWQTYSNALPDAVARAALHCFTYPYRIMFDSNACRAIFEPLNSRHNFCVIHTGLELASWKKRLSAKRRDSARHELGVASSDVVLLLLGTVCERKGQHDLMKALAKVSSATAQRLRCYIVGDRPSEYSRQLKYLQSDLARELRDRVHVRTETQDVATFYQAADIFLCSSRVESYPRVTLEAMASGLPIISTPVFGLTEQLIDEVNAIFYKPGDIVALTAAIERLTQDAALRATMGRESTRVLAGLKSFDEMVDDYVRYFQEAADSK
jgi:glycosyltransferase involved in cell wall biosynthesis